MDTRQKEIALALIQVAWADHVWAPEEEATVANMLLRMGCRPEELQEQTALLRQEADMAKLESVLPDHESRLQAMRMLLAVAFADRVLVGDELDYILRMAERLALTPPELEQLRQEVLGGRSPS